MNDDAVDASTNVKVKNRSHSTTSRLTLSWKDLGYTVTEKKKRKVLLEDINGSIFPGQIMAVMGTSGSGKTTFLNVLAGRVNGRIHGTITLNGIARSKRFSSQSAFVMQDDLLFSGLTVRETFVYTALLRLPRKMSTSSKHERADNIIQELGLNSCKHTIIGNSEIRGVSGGERKRVAIGQALITDPCILFLDEPTSGLDSFTALHVIQTVKELAHRGRAVICSIHQPRAKMFALFDKLLLLSRGKVAFCGPRHEVVDYFSSIGYTCAHQDNPADYLLDVTTIDTRTPELERTTANLTLFFQRQFLKSKFSKLANREYNSQFNLSTGLPIDNDVISDSSRFPLLWPMEFSVLFRRAFKNFIRAKKELMAAFFQTIIFSLLAGFVFFNLGNDQESVQNRSGALFFVVLNQCFSQLMGIINTFHLEKDVFLRERASGSYRVSTYFWAKSLSEFPVQVIFPIVYSTIVYWMMGLRSHVSAYFTFVILMVAIVFNAQSLGLLIGSMTPSPKSANIFASLLMILFMLFSGFYLNDKDIPEWLGWIKWISFLYYGFRAVMFNEYHGLQLTCNNDDSRCFRNGDEVLVFNRMDNIDVWLNFWLLIAIAFCFRILSYLSLRFMFKPMSKYECTGEPIPRDWINSKYENADSVVTPICEGTGEPIPRNSIKSENGKSDSLSIELAEPLSQNCYVTDI